MEMLLVIIVLGAIVYGWYASIVGRRNRAQEALSGIDVQLKKRSNLVPNILTIAKKFMEHERALFEEVTKLRSHADQEYDSGDAEAVATHFEASEQLSAKLGQIMVQVENYPELKSDRVMMEAQRTYNEVEEQIAASRRFYNSSVTSLNNAIQIFPGNVFAGWAGASVLPFYEADAASTQPVNAADILG